MKNKQLIESARTYSKQITHILSSTKDFFTIEEDLEQFGMLHDLYEIQDINFFMSYNKGNTSWFEYMVAVKESTIEQNIYDVEVAIGLEYKESDENYIHIIIDDNPKKYKFTSRFYVNEEFYEEDREHAYYTAIEQSDPNFAIEYVNDIYTLLKAFVYISTEEYRSMRDNEDF